jgi:hypothetical protein
MIEFSVFTGCGRVLYIKSSCAQFATAEAERRGYAVLMAVPRFR